MKFAVDRMRTRTTVYSARAVERCRLVLPAKRPPDRISSAAVLRLVGMPALGARATALKQALADCGRGITLTVRTG